MLMALEEVNFCGPICKAVYPVAEVCRRESEVFRLETESLQCPFSAPGHPQGGNTVLL